MLEMRALPLLIFLSIFLPLADSFAVNWKGRRQSTNVIDMRNAPPGASQPVPIDESVMRAFGFLRFLELKCETLQKSQPELRKKFSKTVQLHPSMASVVSEAALKTSNPRDICARQIKEISRLHKAYSDSHALRKANLTKVAGILGNSTTDSASSQSDTERLYQDEISHSQKVQSDIGKILDLVGRTKDKGFRKELVDSNEALLKSYMQFVDTAEQRKSELQKKEPGLGSVNDTSNGIGQYREYAQEYQTQLYRYAESLDQALRSEAHYQAQLNTLKFNANLNKKVHTNPKPQF